MKKLIYIVTAFICLLAVEAQAQFSITGEIRPRTEFRNGFKKLRDTKPNPAFFVEQRSRLYMDYKNEKVKVRFALQDVRLWGETGQIFKDDNGMTGISEAWAQYNFTSKFGVKAGRQIISYDNQRFLGGLEWAQQGRRHDALLFLYEDADAKLKIHGGFAFNQSDATPEQKKVFGTQYDGVGNYKTMQYLWANKAFEGGSVSALLFNEGHQVATDTLANKQTFGLVAKKALSENFTLAGEAYYQTGETGAALTSVSAYMFDINATYKTSVTPITLGYQNLSGQDADSEDLTAFNPAYGTNHAHNGFMDYFYVGNPHANAGLQDIYLKTKFKVGKGALMAHAHYFLSAVDVMDAEGAAMEAGLGTEFDLVYARKLSPDATLNVGYSQMFGTDTMAAVKGGGDADAIQNWAWVMLTIKPKFFESK